MKLVPSVAKNRLLSRFSSTVARLYSHISVMSPLLSMKGLRVSSGSPIRARTSFFAIPGANLVSTFFLRGPQPVSMSNVGSMRAVMMNDFNFIYGFVFQLMEL